MIRSTILATGLAVIVSAASATDRERVPVPKPTPMPAPHATSSATADGGPINVQGGDHRYLALPGGGGNVSTTAVCVRWRWYGWGAYGTLDPDMECLRLVAELDRLRSTPAPAPVVQLIATTPAVHTNPPAAACVPPARAKSVAQAKASGGCK